MRLRNLLNPIGRLLGRVLSLELLDENQAVD